ncbi:MAG: bifunctional UDP-N-acetylglucosamine diphosphorylase/glucosamine-1-phosphate N-acetyltransferase GlmU [Alphaproteobacteria bacterium]|nr:bifunctional UDP-N-acetylglucosamine diphosphorylase/glucosamine-1-phosphate N-acetyltransferase GlmU [Alphaproteobacteria bacterium]
MRKTKEKSVIILAAGCGSRLKSSLPKIFHRIGGLSLLDHVIMAASEISPEKIVAVLNPKYESFCSEVNEDVIKAFQPVPRGSADTVKCAMNKLFPSDSGWVYVLYGDIPLISAESLNAMYDVAVSNEDTAVVVLAFDAGKDQNLGKLEIGEKYGTIKRIVEAKDLIESDKVVPLCNAGLLVRRDVLNDLLYKIEASETTGEFYITEIVRLAYQSGFDCRYYVSSKEELSGANTRAELATLERYFQDSMRQKILDSGVTLVAPETVFFSYDTEIEKDVTVHPYVVFGKNVKIKSGAEIGPFCVVEGAEVKSAQVGPFARLRSGSEIRDGAKIGNFVEIKNSVVHEKTKVNHLSYIGDSNLGKSTNIGAGTITCNYDGFKKYRTEVGEGVFIGSNSALVAPVKIEDGAVIGAGSVITRDVEPSSLAIARGFQKNIKDWAVNFREKHANSVCKSENVAAISNVEKKDGKKT